jgi:hypothetical protein
MARNDEKQSTSKKQDMLQLHRSSRTTQDQYSGQEGTNPSGNQDQFSVDDIDGQYGSSRDQPGPFDSEELYHKTSSQQSSSPHGQKQKQKRADS